MSKYQGTIHNTSVSRDLGQCRYVCNRSGLSWGRRLSVGMSAHAHRAQFNLLRCIWPWLPLFLRYWCLKNQITCDTLNQVMLRQHLIYSSACFETKHAWFSSCPLPSYTQKWGKFQPRHLFLLYLEGVFSYKSERAQQRFIGGRLSRQNACCTNVRTSVDSP